MASPTETGGTGLELVVGLNPRTNIRSVARDDAESTDNRRAFNITMTDGDIKLCTAQVSYINTKQTIDDLFQMMGWTAVPLNDLKTGADELANQVHTYQQLDGLDATHHGVLAVAFETINLAREYIQGAREISIDHMATEVDLHLQQVKLQHIASARRAYNMSAGVLSEFGLLDDLCEMGKIPQETRDNTLRLISRGKTLFTMWNAAFKEGLFM